MYVRPMCTWYLLQGCPQLSHSWTFSLHDQIRGNQSRAIRISCFCAFREIVTRRLIIFDPKSIPGSSLTLPSRQTVLVCSVLSNSHVTWWNSSFFVSNEATNAWRNERHGWPFRVTAVLLFSGISRVPLSVACYRHALRKLRTPHVHVIDLRYQACLIAHRHCRRRHRKPVAENEYFPETRHSQRRVIRRSLRENRHAWEAWPVVKSSSLPVKSIDNVRRVVRKCPRCRRK